MKVTAIKWIVSERGVARPFLVIDLIHNNNNNYKYAVRDECGRALSLSGTWSDEPMPSSRDSAFLESHRFLTFESACRAAKEQLRMEINGNSDGVH